MAKEETIKMIGRVIELLPNALFKIELENKVVILGHLSGRMRINNININLEDTVDVELSAYDLTRGRIIFRHKRIPLNNLS